MSTPNPMENTYPSNTPSVSQHKFPISGLETIIYGLDQLPRHTSNTQVSCLWLLHPRLSVKEWMSPIAAHIIDRWNQRLAKITTPSSTHRGLICVAFDQRNHGTRLISEQANAAWRNGNPSHAQDMFSVYHGTQSDLSQLIPYVSSYAFPNNERQIVDHMMLGVSLGGHAGWHCVLHEPRISTAVIIIGCADYVRLMCHRAEKSKLDTWRKSDPPGSQFLGSKDFPKGLLDAVEQFDPAGLLMGEMAPAGSEDYKREPTDREKKRLIPMMEKHIQGKKVLMLSGGADKLVPYETSEPFYTWLKNAIRPGGWFADRGVYVEDKVYSGVGHEMTPAMMDKSIAFLVEVLASKTDPPSKTGHKI